MYVSAAHDARRRTGRSWRAFLYRVGRRTASEAARTPPADIRGVVAANRFLDPDYNVDDHLLNHGFLHVERGLWRLSQPSTSTRFPSAYASLKHGSPRKPAPKRTIEALMSVVSLFPARSGQRQNDPGQVEQGRGGMARRRASSRDDRDRAGELRRRIRARRARRWSTGDRMTDV